MLRDAALEHSFLFLIHSPNVFVRNVFKFLLSLKSENDEQRFGEGAVTMMNPTDLIYKKNYVLTSSSHVLPSLQVCPHLKSCFIVKGNCHSLVNL